MTCSSASTNWIGSVGLARKRARSCRGDRDAVRRRRLRLRCRSATRRQRRPPIDPMLLKPGAFVYDMSLERDASTTPLGSRTVSVATTTVCRLACVAVPRDARRRRESPRLIRCSWTRRFIPCIGARRSARHGSPRSSAGTVRIGATSGPPGRRSLVMAVPPRTVVSGAMLESLLRIAPIQVGWEDTSPRCRYRSPSASVSPTRMYVVGEDRVTRSGWDVRLLGGGRADRGVQGVVLDHQARSDRRSQHAGRAGARWRPIGQRAYTHRAIIPNGLDPSRSWKLGSDSISNWSLSPIEKWSLPPLCGPRRPRLVSV